MKSALLRASVAIAIVLSLSSTALVEAQQPDGAGQAPVEQPAQDVGATVVMPEGRQQQSATVQRSQVRVGDGETVSVLRPVTAARETASGQEEDVQRDKPRAWQVAAGGRLWLIDPASGDLRTCAVRNTSTVGVQQIRCLVVSGDAL